MNTIQIFYYCFLAILYCLLYAVTAFGDELADFDFTEIEWNYDGKDNEEQSQNVVKHNSMQPLTIFGDFEEENQVRPIDLRGNVLKSALSKALTNASLRQKFVEVMPILRVLSSQQRLALSALISAQINARENQVLKLEQVRMMFGDNKNLLLPIVFDIANLVRNSASKYLDFSLGISATRPLQNKSADSRMDNVSLVEFDENDHPGMVDIANFFSDTGEEMLDPQVINEELQVVKNNTSTLKKNTLSTNENAARRRKRAVTTPEFVHKLIRSLPPSTNDDINGHFLSGKEVKLNTSGFLSSKDLNADDLNSINRTTLKEEKEQLQHAVEDDALANLNGTALNMQRNTELPGRDLDEPLPSPEELISGPRYRISSNKIHRGRPKHMPTKRKRIRPKGTLHHNAEEGVMSHKKCERFTSSMCIRTEDYPLEQIMGSIRRHKNAMTALWADYHNKYDQLDTIDDFDDFSIRRREDETSRNGMCQSIVRYARPQKARSASGEWKYIVNTGQHTQTLRLEKCIVPQESCSYLSKAYHSQCAQIYNYHRLLSWDQMRGLHVDIFKVPTCCSCQLVAYSSLADTKSRDFTPSLNADVYSTINEELDYNDDQDEDDLSYQVNNGIRKKHKRQDVGLINNQLLLGSQISKTKLHTTKPTLGSYLSPPGDEESRGPFDYVHPHHSSSSSSTSFKKQIMDATRRRPLKTKGPSNIFNEARLDLDFSPSELHQEQEVNFSSGLLATANKRVLQKRQRIHSVLHTAPASTPPISAEFGDAIASVISNSPVAVRAKPNSATTSIRRVAENRGGIATNANQVPTSDSFYLSTLQNQTNFSNKGGVYRNRQLLKTQSPRFRSTSSITSATTEIPGSTQAVNNNKNQWSVHQKYQKPFEKSSNIPSFHGNSIDSKENSTKLDDEARPSIRMSFGPGAKRINYSYHPIIDFFENHKYSNTAAAIKAIDDHRKNTNSQGQSYPKTRELDQPISLVVSSKNSETKPLLRDISGEFRADDNIWHPVILN
uniref:Protein spaetzle n=1 Tax=Ceratitis capitata TaxID=7213 RepID=W8BPS3_CERCA